MLKLEQQIFRTHHTHTHTYSTQKQKKIEWKCKIQLYMRKFTFKRRTNWESKCWQNVFMRFYCNLMGRPFRLFSSIPRAIPKLKTRLNLITKPGREIFDFGSTQRAILNMLCTGKMLKRHNNYMLWTKNYLCIQWYSSENYHMNSGYNDVQKPLK